MYVFLCVFFYILYENFMHKRSNFVTSDLEKIKMTQLLNYNC